MEHRRREPAKGVFRLVLPLPFPGLDRVNAYALAAEDGCILVDCGMRDPSPENDHGWRELVDALAACGLKVNDVNILIVTHPHIDHYGLAGRVVEEAGCELWMHRAASDELHFFENPDAAAHDLRALMRDHGVTEDEVNELTAFEDWRAFVWGAPRPTRSLGGGEGFAVGGREWEIVHTPGHDAGHLCVWSGAERILISGDTLLGSITPHIDFRRGDEDPLGAFLDSLRKIEELSPDLVLPGHGRPFEDGAGRARAIARHHDRRLGAIVQVIRRRPHTASEVTDEIFGQELLDFQRRLALGEALAHLAHLRATGEIERIEVPEGGYAYLKATRRRK